MSSIVRAARVQAEGKGGDAAGKQAVAANAVEPTWQHVMEYC